MKEETYCSCPGRGNTFGQYRHCSEEKLSASEAKANRSDPDELKTTSETELSSPICSF